MVAVTGLPGCGGGASGEPDRFRPQPAWREVPIILGPTRVPEITCEVELRPGVRVPFGVVVDTGAMYALSLTLGTGNDIALPPGSRDCVMGYSNWGRVTGSLGRATAASGMSRCACAALSEAAGERSLAAHKQRGPRCRRPRQARERAAPGVSAPPDDYRPR